MHDVERLNTIFINTISVIFFITISCYKMFENNSFKYYFLNCFSTSINGKITKITFMEDSELCCEYRYEYIINDKTYVKIEKSEYKLKGNIFSASDHHPTAGQIEYFYLIPQISRIKFRNEGPSFFNYYELFARMILLAIIFVVYWKHTKSEIKSLLRDYILGTRHFSFSNEFSWKKQLISFIIDFVIIYILILIPYFLFYKYNSIFPKIVFIIFIIIYVPGIYAGIYEITKRMDRIVSIIVNIIIWVSFIIMFELFTEIYSIVLFALHFATLKSILDILLHKLGYSISYPVVDWISVKLIEYKLSRNKK